MSDQETEDEVTFAGLAQTEDTNDPVIRVKKGGSWMDIILDTQAKRINVWYVTSKEKGDMKDMLDECVRQLPTNNIRFISPLEEDDKRMLNEVLNDKFEHYNKRFESQGDIEDVLEGFEKKVVEVDGNDTLMLDGNWEL